eukprot:50546-Hanusia_phi.AAC.4
MARQVQNVEREEKKLDMEDRGATRSQAHAESHENVEGSNEFSLSPGKSLGCGESQLQNAAPPSSDVHESLVKDVKTETAEEESKVSLVKKSGVNHPCTVDAQDGNDRLRQANNGKNASTCTNSEPLDTKIARKDSSKAGSKASLLIASLATPPRPVTKAAVESDSPQAFQPKKSWSTLFSGAEDGSSGLDIDKANGENCDANAPKSAQKDVEKASNIHADDKYVFRLIPSVLSDHTDSNNASSNKLDQDDSSSESCAMASDDLGRVGNLKGGYVKGQWTKEVSGRLRYPVRTWMRRS